ncbi:tRNA 5-methoxyuridine(34)/uridine 5-oxyacetic acid(34) synthase CmoB [Galenea microaerophila]
MKHYFAHYENFWPKLQNTRLESWQQSLPPLLETALSPENNGNLPRWLPAIEHIMQMPSSETHQLNASAITARSKHFEQQAQLKSALQALKPWRKGPFDLEGIYIDTEWRSDWKWDRVLPHLSPLAGKKVLDIGCGSGYHLWRMLGEGARFAVGVDPSLLFMTQFLAVKHFVGHTLPAWFLPLTLEQLPTTPYGGDFDTVFSMGVLYHRRSPIDHLLDLKRHLKSGGELVLETLVIPEAYGQILLPRDRYAQMKNVWFLPSVSELVHWMTRCGYQNVRCVDLDQTSTEEQRSTEWMEWNSLKDFLDPNDPTQTVEGYPAPLRAVVLAEAP